MPTNRAVGLAQVRIVLLVLMTALSAAMVFGLARSAAQSDPVVHVIKIDGVIDPVTAGFASRSIERANDDRAEALIIELDTPGGLDESMRTIIKAMLASKVPVVVYVSPSGARAASAGAFILIASHVSAMAPGTNVGAAHPVNVGGGEQPTAVEEKVLNDAVAYIRSLAERRGRNAEWAEDAVRKSVSVSAERAKAIDVADLIAPNLPKLLDLLDGRKVEGRTLKTEGARIERFEMAWQEEFLHTLANPNIAFILMLVGIYGLIFELSNPGAILPGVAGAISLILALFAFQALPVNLAGLLLILLAVVLFVLELFATSHGMLSLGGVFALSLGGLMLFNVPGSFTSLSLGVLIPAVLLTAAFFLFAVGAGLRAQRRPVTKGVGYLTGAVGTTRTRIDPQGQVFLEGALWQAESEAPIEKGERVEVIGREGIVLKVRPIKREG